MYVLLSAASFGDDRVEVQCEGRFSVVLFFFLWMVRFIDAINKKTYVDLKRATSTPQKRLEK